MIDYLRCLRAALVRDLAAGERHLPDPGAGRWLLVTAALAAAAAVATYLVGGYHAGFLTLNAWAGPLPPILWQAVTALGDEHLVLGLLLLAARRHPRLLWTLFWAAMLGLVYSQGLKHGIGALRPPAVLPEGSFRVIGPALHKRSFPSGHTQVAFTVAGVVLCFVRGRSLRLFLLLSAVLVGLSRVALGVHWPLDVLAGAAGGALCAWGGLLLAQRWRWGLRPAGHLLLVLLLAAFPVQLLFGWDGGLTGIAPMLYLSGLAILARAAEDYLLPDCPDS